MRWILLVTMVGAMACAQDSAVAPAAPANANALAGTYGLSTVNNLSPPQTLGTDGVGLVDLLSGTLQLNADASYLDILTFRERGSAGIAIVYDTIRGDYLHFDQTLLLNPKSGGESSFFVISDANTLVSPNPGFSLVYRR
jgi:hypothetical protein